MAHSADASLTADEETHWQSIGEQTTGTLLQPFGKVQQGSHKESGLPADLTV